MASDTPRDEFTCGVCNKSFTARSLDEHLQSRHLGTECHFPGSNFKLSEENDVQMTEALMRANDEAAGGQSQIGDKHLCFWPDCKGGKQPHDYGSHRALKRHLQTKQRKLCERGPKILDAWSQVNHHIVVRDARLDCLGVLLQHPREQVGISCKLMFNFVQEANDALDAAIRHVRSLTPGQDTNDGWDQFFQQYQDTQQIFSRWASNLDFNPGPDHLSWHTFRKHHTHLSGLLRNLEHPTTTNPHPQPATQPAPDNQSFIDPRLM
ncbi:hypothetical protein F5Y13DRAFT_184952 [Hypoxylon sp. FL1857]|nr:hypothetical protein F5Y13DRAFT_184952 [Hypoxylon sp. FL1857]